MASFDDHDPRTFAANFTPIEKPLCTDCHVAREAGDSCTMCHNYHVGVIAPVMRGAEMAAGE